MTKKSHALFKVNIRQQETDEDTHMYTPAFQGERLKQWGLQSSEQLDHE